MKRQSHGKRYHLLLYESHARRYRGRALLLALLLSLLWVLVRASLVAWPKSSSAPWLFGGTLVCTLFWIYTVVGPRLAYVQPRADRIRLQTPIYRLNISYRRLRNTRPIDFMKLYFPEGVPNRYRRLLRPFFGATAIGIDLHELPLPTWLLRVFFSKLMIAPDLTGFVLLVQDWMSLSNELDVLMEDWRYSSQEHRRGPGLGASEILSE